jgi:tetratricopeptide (TPR) repeat protein
MRKAIAVLLFLLPVAAFASSSSPMSMPSAQPRDPQEEAKRSYNDGLKYRDRAWAAEKELKTATDPKRQATLKEVITKSYKADIRQQRAALQADPSLYQAQTELGYALRKTGEYQAALEEYDKALQKMPNYAEAVEYRAEAYLALNRVEDAKQSYLTLYNAGDQTRSAELGAAMQTWLAAKKADPAGISADELTKFSEWVSARKEIATATGTVTSGGSWK